ncbi:MAG: hypothetical protein EOP09_19790, partial [Proteobacteria bacterium]
MKSLTWILIATTLNLAACGPGSQSLSGRDLGKAKNSNVNGQEKGNGVFTAPENSVAAKLQLNESGSAKLRVQKQTILTDFQCVSDLLSESTLKANEAIKVLEGSQILLAQDTTAAENTLPGSKKVTKKIAPVVNIMCVRATGTGLNGLTANVEVDQTIRKLRIETGAAEQFGIKMGTASRS